MVKEIEANLCFSILGKILKIQNGRHFWGEEIFFENCQEYISEIPYGSEILTKSLPCMIKEIEGNLCFFHFWQSS